MYVQRNLGQEFLARLMPNLQQVQAVQVRTECLVHTTAHWSAAERRAPGQPSPMAWVNFKSHMLRERSQAPKAKHSPHIGNAL